jgi:predicted membrane-bound mannosyltransferase
LNKNMGKLTFRFFVVAIILLSTFLRFYNLDLRPFHHDEGVNSSFLLTLIKSGTYEYNPENFHGPLLYYITYIPMTIFGLKSSIIKVDRMELGDISFRLAPAFFGLVLVILFLALRSWLGASGVIAAMVITAISPSFLFYSRYNIHEIYLMVFTLLAFITGYYFFKTGKNIYIYLSFISLALMFTLKETAIVSSGIWGLSFITTVLIQKVFIDKNKISEVAKTIFEPLKSKIHAIIFITGFIVIILTFYMMFKNPSGLAEKSVNFWYISLLTKGLSTIAFILIFSFFFEKLRKRTLHIILGSILFMVIISIFFSSLFTYSKGIASFFVAFEKWLLSGTVESQHTKSFFYFLQIMFKFESPILLFGILGLILLDKRKDPVLIFTSSWVVLAFSINSAIPYKTPWLVLNLLLPMILLAAKFIEYLISNFQTKFIKAIFTVISILIIIRNGYASIDVSFINYDKDDREIVYVQTLRDIKKLSEKTLELTKKFNGDSTKINYLSPDEWPLPWYFRDLTYVSYCKTVTDQPDAPIIIAKKDQSRDLESKLKNRYKKEDYTLRPGVDLVLYYQDPGGVLFSDEYIFKQPVQVETSKLKLGLKAQVFSNTDFSGNVIAEKVDTLIDFSYDTEDQKPYKSPFSIVWTGYIYAPEDGNYTFITESDDGSYIYLNNKIIVDNGGVHGTERKQTEVYLQKGYYNFNVRYFDNYFGAIMKLKWIPKGGSEEFISSNNMFYSE